MAKIFLSYSSLDEDLARDIESRLKKIGHTFQYPAGTLPSGQWRKKLGDALEKSDVLVALLSSNGLQSSFVCSEVGAARVYERIKDMLLLPVLIGEQNFPLFISDYACFELREDGSENRSKLVDKLNEAIVQHEWKPRIFVSHRHKNEAQARALIELIEAYFIIKKRDIRCTSVSPYKLELGDRTSERLKSEIRSAEVVIGLLSKDTSESKYVLAELGAAWGVGVPTFPLRIQGAKFEDVPEPLNERHSLSLVDEEECFQLLQDIARLTSLNPAEDMLSRVKEKAAALAKLCIEDIKQPNASKSKPIKQ